MNKYREIFASISLVLIVSLFVGGCEPLRKKFIRQKKKDETQSDAFVPILEPIDYPDKVYTIKEVYKKHYSLWQVWSRELLTTLDEETLSPKKNVYNLDQVIMQVDIMRQLLIEEKQGSLAKILEELKALRGNLERLVLSSDRIAAKSKYTSIEKKIRTNYKSAIIEPILSAGPLPEGLEE